VGLVLGNIRLPAVLVVASHPSAGAGANIGISGVAALAAAIVHVRAGRINWRLFAWMAPPSMVGAVAGGYLSGRLPDKALLITIGAVLVYFGIDLLAIGSAASVPGALLGARLTGRLSERQLLPAIGAMLVVAGATTALQALV
jgi:uncharacterized membrane protein YfcA